MAINMSENQITLEIIKALKETRRFHFQSIISELQPYDIARIFEGLPVKHHPRFLLYMTPEQIAELIQELEQQHQARVLSLLGIEKSGEVLDLMDNDDIAALLEGMSAERMEELLSGMKLEESRIVKSIMKYPPETAGRLMTNRFVWIPQHYTVRDTVEKIKSFAEYSETINYLYVINENKELVGVVSYRDLILANENEKIQDIMYSRVIAVAADTDQEEVARLIERYDFLAIPVVEKGQLVGIVTFDDIIDVVISEANEDIEKLSASGRAIDFDTKPLVAAYRRLPWLILLLFIGIVSGTIISGFEETLSQAVALAFFMPMIAGMTGNTGTQSLAVVVRGLINRDLDKRLVTKLVFRELSVGIIIGVTCGILIAVIAYVWQGSFILGLVVGTSLIITLIIGTLAGTIIPLVLYKLNVDPAVASGPLITTLNDILSLFIYFGLATIFITKLT
ncbi:magnesium transporter [Cytobacillus oceanisediminis]|uniref:Magnesium transporter MgtE n=1 Tax=Cytobacillus oceanisediminis TaxID=665099 RepID=A0A562JDQ1_9BACI|nr:magnesium transporter [Cytobacillus oceanisediminis]TWH81346.1 magnesium transporter [Cytobacillus oceanisediminis]